ncbi:MAG: hypothetical protein R3345_14535 [Fulvivirga sp.]|nr:hypothetical protein [Fulvivirga sp.]
MSQSNDPVMSKVELIMESPSERNKYQQLNTFDEKIEFLRNHFILKDMEVRMLERRYLLSPTKREELIAEVDGLIKRMEY